MPQDRTVCYLSKTDLALQIAQSSQPKQIPIVPQDDFARAFDTHIVSWLSVSILSPLHCCVAQVDWIVFLAAAIALVYVPFQLYQGSVEKYSSKLIKSK